MQRSGCGVRQETPSTARAICRQRKQQRETDRVAGTRTAGGGSTDCEEHKECGWARCDDSPRRAEARELGDSLRERYRHFLATGFPLPPV